MSEAEREAAQQDPDVAGAPGRRRARGRRRHTVARVLLATVLVLGLVTGLSVVFLWRHLNGNLTVMDVTSQLDNRPDKVEVEGPQEPLNVLVMGSDSREGDGNNIDGLTGGGARSDTTIMFHLSADRNRAYGVSIPRDSLVDRPECVNDAGETIAGGTDVMWNEAFALGGPACTIQQFEQLTGVRIDHYVVVDFNGFQDMVDAIDGVQVCIPEDIDDPEHGINIPAGTREVRGKEALNYVRARYTLGDGSDIGRIKRQQAFIAAMTQKVISGGTLARVDRLVRFLNAATKSLTTDLESIDKIARVGLGFQDIGLGNIKFITVPWEYETREEYRGRVSWTDKADVLWRRIAKDGQLTRDLDNEVIKADAVPGTTTSPSPDPSGSGTPSAGESPSASGSASAAPDERDAERVQALEAAGLCT